MKTPTQAHTMQQNAAQAEAMLKMLANQNRLMLLCHLVKGEKTVNELVSSGSMSQSSVSQHLARLTALELVDSRKEGKQVYYWISSPEVEAILSTLYLIYCR